MLIQGSCFNYVVNVASTSCKDNSALEGVVNFSDLFRDFYGACRGEESAIDAMQNEAEILSEQQMVLNLLNNVAGFPLYESTITSEGCSILEGELAKLNNVAMGQDLSDVRLEKLDVQLHDEIVGEEVPNRANSVTFKGAYRSSYLPDVIHAELAVAAENRSKNTKEAPGISAAVEVDTSGDVLRTTGKPQDIPVGEFPKDASYYTSKNQILSLVGHDAKFSTAAKSEVLKSEKMVLADSIRSESFQNTPAHKAASDVADEAVSSFGHYQTKHNKVIQNSDISILPESGSTKGFLSSIKGSFEGYRLVRLSTDQGSIHNIETKPEGIDPLPDVSAVAYERAIENTHIAHESDSDTGGFTGSSADKYFTGKDLGDNSELAFGNVFSHAAFRAGASQDSLFLSSNQASRFEMMNQLSESFTLMMEEGRVGMEIQIHPESLGKLQLRIVNESGVYSAFISAETAYAKDLIQSHLNDLRASLKEQGLDFFRLDVSLGDSQSNDGQWSWQKNYLQRNSGHDFLIATLVGVTHEKAVKTHGTIKISGHIDCLV